MSFRKDNFKIIAKIHIVFYLNYLILNIINCCQPVINRLNEKIDFENFIQKFNVKYRVPKLKEDAYDNFINKKGAIYTRGCINRNQCEGSLELTSEAGVSKFFDLSQETFRSYLSKIEINIKNVDKIFLDFKDFLINQSVTFNKQIKTNKLKSKNLIYFDWRIDNEFNSFDLFQENTKNTNFINQIFSELNHPLKTKDSELVNLMNLYENSQRPNSVFEELNEFKERIKKYNQTLINSDPKMNLINYKKYFNFEKLASFHNDEISEMYRILIEIINLFKEFYVYTKYSDEEELEYLIKNVGPVYVEINAAGLDFYINGIFNPNSCEMKSNPGSTGVILLGWGVGEKYEYWIAKSFFGKDWGDDGYFKILKGHSSLDSKKFAIALDISKFKSKK